MRHLELPPCRRDFDDLKTDSSSIEIKDEDLDALDIKTECGIEIKDEDLEDLDIKDDFINEIPLDVSLESDSLLPSDESYEEIEDKSPAILNLKLKNRRKNSQPQKAIKSECSNSNSDSQSNDQNDLDEEESEDIESDIFKGLKEETGEEFDEEMERNVKEEWKAYWGVKCNMCDKMFTFKLQFERHYRKNYNKNPMYTCPFCDKTMDKYSTFRSHCYRHITEGRHKCCKCNKGFSAESMLHDHIIAKHTQVKPFTCEECGKGFVTKPGLKIHLKKHLNGEKEDYPCLECGKILHTRGGLTAHMNVHRLGRRFMCDVCGKTFTQKVNMLQHVKHHSGERPFSCDKCGKCFAEKSHLARHYSFHSEKRPFKCEVCQKMYKTERCLKVHSMVHASSRPFVCSYCSKGFLSSTKLKQHLNIHTGQRPFKCKYCERTFTNFPNWLKHIRRRHKVDHKTGMDLVPKQEVVTLPPAPETGVEPNPDLSNFIMDYASRDEETQLNNCLPQYSDDRINLPQHLDIFSNATPPYPVNLVVPYYSQDPLQDYITQTNLMDVQSQIIPQNYPEQLAFPQLIQQQMLQM